MSQSTTVLNRAQRRQLARAAKHVITHGAGVGVTLTGARIVRPDGSTKHEIGTPPPHETQKEAARDTQ